MAKYILPSVGHGVHKVPCAIIDENRSNKTYASESKSSCAGTNKNRLTETYTVKFTNGVIKNVSKNKVQDLDILDESLLDTLRKGVNAVTNFFGNIYNKVVATGKVIYTAVAGVGAPHLGNIMLAASDEDNDFLGFIPSTDIARSCEEAGIDATQTINESEDLEIYNDINAYWHTVMENEPDFAPANESVHSRKRQGSLNETTDVPDIQPKDGSEGHPIIDREGAYRKITRQYNAQRNGVSSEEPPVLLWGAPGIGKTQIITDLASLLSEHYNGKVNVVTINALGFRKDSFALPNFETVDQEFFDEEGNKMTIPIRIPKDYVKSWLPSYDPRMAEKMVRESARLGNQLSYDEAIAILDNIANGGHPANPETHEKEVEGQGGIIFIDEVSRVSREVMNIFMNFLQTRVLNGEVLGSRWIFAAAANRFTDLSEKAKKEIAWESAWGDRFSMYNFVPKVQEWLDWGAEEVEIDGKRMTRIDPDVLAYIKGNPNMYYSAASANLKLADVTAKDRIPNPRSWKQYTDAKRADLAYAKEFGVKPTQAELKSTLQSLVGSTAANSYFAWLNGPGKDLTNEQAAEILENGSRTAAKKFTNTEQLLGPHGALARIINQHPDVVAELPKEDRILTPDQWYNITDYLRACVDAAGMSEIKSSSAASMAQAIRTELLSDIQKTFSSKVSAAIIHPTDDNNPYLDGHQNLEDMKKWNI